MQVTIPPVMKTVLPRRQDKDPRSLLSREIEYQYTLQTRTLPQTINKVLHNVQTIPILTSYSITVYTFFIVHGIAQRYPVQVYLTVVDESTIKVTPLQWEAR